MTQPTVHVEKAPYPTNPKSSKGTAAVETRPGAVRNEWEVGCGAIGPPWIGGPSETWGKSWIKSSENTLGNHGENDLKIPWMFLGNS